MEKFPKPGVESFTAVPDACIMFVAAELKLPTTFLSKSPTPSNNRAVKNR